MKRSFTDRLLSTTEAARYLGLKRTRLKDWRRRNRRGGPVYVRLTSRLVRYQLQDLEEFIRSRRVVHVKRVRGKGR